MEQPPAHPSPPRSTGLDKFTKRLVYLVILVSVILCILRVFGLVRPFSIPTSAMAPTISGGDLIVMENFTYFSRQPRRGDLAIFKTDGIPSLQTGSIYVKRVAGESGDRVRIAGGKLSINDKHLPLRNQSGEIIYLEPRTVLGKRKQVSYIDVTVPEGCYYVLGDNQPNSLDSRYWGFVPKRNIIGQVSFRIWPPRRIGSVK